MHAMHMRAVEHTIRRGLCTHHAARVNYTENRYIGSLLSMVTSRALIAVEVLRYEQTLARKSPAPGPL
jgi:hypothetical protein